MIACTVCPALDSRPCVEPDATGEMVPLPGGLVHVERMVAEAAAEHVRKAGADARRASAERDLEKARAIRAKGGAWRRPC